MLSRKAKVQEEKHRLRELRANQVRVYSITQIPATAPQSILLFSFFLFFLVRAALMVYVSSQARGQIRAEAASLSHSHSITRSKAHLQPTPQLTAKMDPC